MLATSGGSLLAVVLARDVRLSSSQITCECDALHIALACCIWPRDRDTHSSCTALCGANPILRESGCTGDNSRFYMCYRHRADIYPCTTARTDSAPLTPHMNSNQEYSRYIADKTNQSTPAMRCSSSQFRETHALPLFLSYARAAHGVPPLAPAGLRSAHPLLSCGQP